MANNSEHKIAFDDGLVHDLLDFEEGNLFEVKRIRGGLSSTLESIVAFANTEGGLLVIGFEDPDKGQGADRIYGLQEKLENWDELKRLVRERITDYDKLSVKVVEIGCTLRDGSNGSVGIYRIGKSAFVHSIVNDGTWIRLEKGNRELTAQESTELQFSRGSITAESQLETVPFELLDTDFWKNYVQKRGLTRKIDEAMYHIGLAKKDADGELKPTRAATLLFAEEPSGLLASKAAIRVFHYKGTNIETGPTPNLIKPPKTISGPLILQIQNAREYVISELSEGVQVGPFGFEIVQKYPLRVIHEAITNAVIHRDYHISNDIQIRIFADRIEIESPGTFAGPVTATNISTIGTHARNSLIVDNLREFPTPPNLDAGEGVRMMFSTMKQSQLYPPIYKSQKQTGRKTILVTLRNQSMPTAWEQVSDYLDTNGHIANRHVRQILETEDTLKASKLLSEWVKNGLLEIENPDKGTKARMYIKAEEKPLAKLIFSLFGAETS